MKVSMLHYSNSIIDFNRLFGMQISEINTLNQLLDRGVDATLFTRKVVGEHRHIKELEYESCDRMLNDGPFYTRFIDASADSDILQGNATPLLAAFRPEKTIIRINGRTINFPFADQAQFQEYYQRAYYFFVSEYIQNEFVRKYPFLRNDHCFVLHNAVDICDEPQKEPAEKLRMVFASRWVGPKGMHILLHAIRMLQKKRNDFELYVAGGIHTTDKNDMRALQLENRIKSELGKLKNTHVIGYMQPAKLHDLFGQMDLLLFPSICGEAFSSMPLQAAMVKVPTIGFDDGSLREGVIHGRTGILLDKNRYERINAYKLYRALDQLLDQRQILEKMGNEARKRTIEKFNWDVHISSLLNIYTQIATNNL